MKILHFFDKLEDRIRGVLSRHPIVYAIIAGFAVVLFWRGVWMSADEIPFLTGPVSILISVVIMLVTGLFVSFFVGDSIILSGIRGEKKLVEKTKDEVTADKELLAAVQEEVIATRSEIKEVEGQVRELRELLDEEKRLHHTQ